MAVPKEIREVPRPINTIVEDNGKDGIHRYAVRERSGITYVAGGNPQPKNGKVIGHIYDGKFIPKQIKLSPIAPTMLSYGSSALVKSVSDDLLDDLLKIFSLKDACTIMAIASLRIIRPHISCHRMNTHYKRTFVSVYYPGLALSANSISNFLQELGMSEEQRIKFYQLRTMSVMSDHHVVIDGTLKQDNSDVNDLSAFSYKGRVKGIKDISIIYAYDLEEGEPICAEVFPGNCIDAKSYSRFIKNNDLRKGVIVADKGFPPSQIKDDLEARPDLHFITPIRRNDVRINNNEMLEFEGVISGIGKRVFYKKATIKGGKYLYAFKDVHKASMEENEYALNLEKHENFSQSSYLKKRNLFGVIVFESDLNLDPKTIYQCYESRWKIELVFKRYKNDICLDKTEVQNDFSVIGSEFINFIANVITCRIINKAIKLDLMNKISFTDLIDDLTTAWRRTDAPNNPKTNDEYWVHTFDYVFDYLEAFGLSEPIAKPEPKKRGRKPKPKVEKPKRPRGRPRKNQASI